MKRVFILTAISALLSTSSFAAPDASGPTNSGAVLTDPAPTAASIAAQQAADERYKRMTADIEALQADNESLKAKINTLEQKIEELRQLQAAAAASQSGVQADLRRLAESISAVDKRREEDKVAISEQIRSSIANLEKALAAAPPPRIHEAPPPKVHQETDGDGNLAPAPVTAETGYTYTVLEGQNLYTIVKAYNEEFKNKGWKPITLKQAMAANPKVDFNRLTVGQKIIIPKPEAQ